MTGISEGLQLSLGDQQLSAFFEMWISVCSIADIVWPATGSKIGHRLTLAAASARFLARSSWIRLWRSMASLSPYKEALHERLLKQTSPLNCFQHVHDNYALPAVDCVSASRHVQSHGAEGAKWLAPTSIKGILNVGEQTCCETRSLSLSMGRTATLLVVGMAI